MTETCELSVPIYPARYTIKERQSGASAYAYSDGDLESGYPQLKHSQYTIRLLREGFIYLYDANKGENRGLRCWKVNKEGSFTELMSTTATLESLQKLYKTGRTVNFITTSAKSTEVYIGYSDTLWTNSAYAKIVSNEDNIRDVLMIKINIKEWTDTQKGKNTFPVEKIDQLVEEYRDPQWQTQLKWSMRETEPLFETGDILSSVMAAQPRCEAQIVAVLYDNIGLLEDQKMLIHYYRSFHSAYTAEHHRKKLISDLIEQVYTQNYATEKNISDEQTARHALHTDIKEKKLYYKKQRQALESNRSHSGRYGLTQTNRAQQILKNEPVTQSDYRSEVLTEVVERQAKHINETERKAFINDYNNKTDPLLKKVIEAKNDRCKLLRTYTKTTQPTDLGSAFLTYDKDNPISGGAHAQSYANITEGMMADLTTLAGVTNEEHCLFHDWWQLPKASNPLLINLKLDDNLLTYALENKADTSASITEGIDGLGSMLSPNFASSEITHNLVVYTLRNNWQGVVKNNIDEMFQKLINAPSKESAKELRTILEGNHQKLSGNYKAATVAVPISANKYYRQFGKAAELSDNSIERIVHASGSLKDEKAIITIAHVSNEGKFKNAMENPFGGKVSGSVSLLAIVLFAFNLKNAITTVRQDELDSFTNLGSAVFGLGSGINALAISIKPVLGTQSYARLVAQFGVIEVLSSVWWTRFFGYGGALFEGVTQGIKSYKAHAVGDTDAGNYYALAAIALPAGGIIAMEGGLAAMGVATFLPLAAIPVAGWIIGGLVLLGAGIYFLFKADAAIDTPMEIWLDSSSFGIHQRSDSIHYQTEEDEHNGFIDALYAPQILSYDWNAELIGKEDTTFEIYQPARDEYYRFNVQVGYALPPMDTTIRKDVRPSIKAWNPDKMHTVVEDFKGAGNGYRYTMHIKNIPKGSGVLTGCLFYVPLMQDRTDTHWVKQCFQITRGYGIFSDLKSIPAK